ncbi:MAG: DNA primase [Candidatus Gracilibacteria bacterium]
MSIIEELENSIDIVDLVGKYARLKKVGANYKSLCPFPGHSEKTPSFVVSPSKQIAYCFGCHKGGGPIKFVMDIENCEFKEAVEILGNLTGVKVKGFENMKDKEVIKNEKNLYTLYKDIANYYKSSLKKYSEIQEYIKDRGLNEESIDTFSLGYSDDGINLYNYLKERGYDDNVIQESQVFLDLAKRRDKFLARVIFPIKNHRGDTVAFAGRIINSGEPKYLNSPASRIYDKSNILYGLFEARQEITKKDFVIITEGYMDTISLHQYGFKNTVAVSGTALTEKHLILLKRLTNKIYLCFDNDKAGEQATRLSLEILKNKGFEVKIIVMEGGKDPDELLKSGIDFNEFIEKAVSPVVFFIKKSKFDIKSIDDKKNTLKTILEVLKSYSDNIEKDFYIKEISNLLDIPTKLIYDELNKIPNKKEDLGGETSLQITSQDFAISYIIIDKKHREQIGRELIFLDDLDSILKDALKEDNFLNNYTLEKKELYRGLALEMEERLIVFTPEKIKDDIKKLCQKINSDIFKKESVKLKDMLLHDGNNLEALIKYNNLIKKAKEMKIV